MPGSPPIQAPQPVLPQRSLARALDVVWPVIGVGAVLLSGWFLLHELRHLSWDELKAAFAAIPPSRWLCAVGATVLAYGALAWYDRIALSHLGVALSWRFISAVSFTAYALSHNIGMTMVSGTMVRYRAYSTCGLTLTDVGIVTAFCSLTFALGTVLLGGVVCLVAPAAMADLVALPPMALRLLGCCLLGLVGLYLFGSARHLRPLVLWGIRLVYPRPGIALRQVVAGPLELIGAAGIIFWALPADINPGFLVVVGVFLASFTAALLSHAPGGLGVLELVFMAGMPDVPQADIVAALLVFRLLYLIVPLVLGIVAVLAFERSLLGRLREPQGGG